MKINKFYFSILLLVSIANLNASEIQDNIKQSQTLLEIENLFDFNRAKPVVCSVGNLNTTNLTVTNSTTLNGTTNINGSLAINGVTSNDVRGTFALSSTIFDPATSTFTLPTPSNTPTSATPVISTATLTGIRPSPANFIISNNSATLTVSSAATVGRANIQVLQLILELSFDITFIPSIFTTLPSITAGIENLTNGVALSQPTNSNPKSMFDVLSGNFINYSIDNVTNNGFRLRFLVTHLGIVPLPNPTVTINLGTIFNPILGATRLNIIAQGS